MSKKKVTPSASKAASKASKATAAKAQAAAAANPVAPRDVIDPPKAPASGSVSKSAPPARLPFRRPQTFNFAGVGRNDICPCGSGKRFKNCHGS
jgi:preprotein translocase subunit SecA